MYYVHLIRSQRFPLQHYIGFTTDVVKRLKKHNEGGVPCTACYKPWEVVTYLAFSNKKQALNFESYLKTAFGRAFASKRLW